MNRRLIIMLAIAVGIIVANLYYAQPLIAMIGPALGLAPGAAGLVVTLTQLGYGLGVLLVVPLGDMIENRRLILIMVMVTLAGLLGLVAATSLLPYFFAAFATGLGASSVQIIVPYAAHFAPEAKRGQAMGNLMSGLMLGIMLSRPAASLMTEFFGWHAVFVLSMVLMSLLAGVLYFRLPLREPSHQRLRYPELIGSMLRLFVETPALRRRSIYQACLFGSFSLFWTASPLLLAGPDFRLSQFAIAIFALVGVSGAIAAPLAGRAADRGWVSAATLVAMLMASGSFLMSHLMPLGSSASVGLLALGAICLDAGISANLVLGQRVIFSLNPEFRGRLNGVYIATIFVGGAAGSWLGAWSYAQGGWHLTSWVGFAMPLIALIYFLTEKQGFISKNYLARNRRQKNTPEADFL